MRRYLSVALAALSLLLLVSCSRGATAEDIEHAYGSGFEAGMEAADEAKYHAEKNSPPPIENREPTVSMVPTPNSSCFSSVGYNDGTLYVTFRDSGSVYSYEDIPGYVYDELWDASSMGGYYNDCIKGCYTCRKLS